MNDFDLNFERLLMQDEAKEIYENIISFAHRRNLEPDYVIEKILFNVRNLAKEDGYL